MTYGVDNSTQEEYTRLGQIVRKSRLFEHLVETEYVDAMSSWRDARHPGTDKSHEAKSPPTRALELWVQHHNDG